MKKRTITLTIIAWTTLSLALLGCMATSGPPIDRHASPGRALLVLDMQRDFLEAEARLPIARGQVEPLLSTTNALVAQAEQDGVEIVYVRNAFSSGDLLGNLFRNDAALEGSPGAELDSRLQVRGPLFDKRAPDAFSNEALDALLRERRVGHLYVVGVFADQCVYWTIRGALNRNYRVTVIPEALGAASDDDRAEALDDLRDAGVEVLEPGGWTGLFGGAS